MRSLARTGFFQFGLFIVVLILFCGCHRKERAQTLAEKVVAMPCFSSDVEQTLADAGDRLGSLSKDDSVDADKALVMLMGYYLGEHNGEDLETEIVRRGKRMRPLLVQEQSTPVSLASCAPRLEKDILKRLASDAIGMIDQGRAYN
jgi:hypothetical protein